MPERRGEISADGEGEGGRREGKDGEVKGCQGEKFNIRDIMHRRF